MRFNPATKFCLSRLKNSHIDSNIGGTRPVVQDPSPIISAEAILKSGSGRSLAHTTEPVTAANVAFFAPRPETTAQAAAQLQALGFTVVTSGITMTLEGPATRFEDVFQLHIQVSRDDRTGALQLQPSGDVTIPDSLKPFVESIVFPEPPEYFTSP